MALNTASAIAYNKERGYSQKAIGIIQFVVNAKTTGVWDSQAVQAVHDWQKSKNGQIDADGKVGPATLGYFIGELELAYRKPEADVLRQFPHKMGSESGPGKQNAVDEFTHQTVKQPRLGKFTEGGKPMWGIQGSFKVRLTLSPALSESERCKYEYRQYIKGSLTIEDGSWNGPIWNAKPGTKKSIGSKVTVPVDPKNPSLGFGLTSSWKEDGLDRTHEGRGIRRFGYRDYCDSSEPGYQNQWLPDQNGHIYALQDSFGYAEPYFKIAIRITLEYHYKGEVVRVTRDPNTEETVPVEVVKSKIWSYKFDEKMNWDKLPPL